MKFKELQAGDTFMFPSSQKYTVTNVYTVVDVSNGRIWCVAPAVRGSVDFCATDQEVLLVPATLIERVEL